jgi:hypothetical protein
MRGSRKALRLSMTREQDRKDVPHLRRFRFFLRISQAFRPGLTCVAPMAPDHSSDAHVAMQWPPREIEST